MKENELSHVIIGAAIEVHKELGGPGLFEDIYEEALCAELALRGIHIERQIEIPVVYKGKRLNKNYRLDVLIDDLVIVEIKATEEHHSIYKVQLLTHLRLTNKKLGLLINFGQKYLKNGIHRIVNGLQER
jgi:GxxExxY protein